MRPSSSAKTLAPSDGPDLPQPPHRKPLPRRRIRTSALARAAAGARRSGCPATPLLRWKFADSPRRRRRNAAGDPSAAGPAPAPEVSARRLAAGIWHLQLSPEPNVSGPRTSGLHNEITNDLSSPISVTTPKHASLLKLEASGLLLNPAMERATKWDSGFSKASQEAYRFYGHTKLLEDQQVATVSAVTALQSELEQARSRVKELETVWQSEKKKLDRFLRKLAEEKAEWRRREHEKVRAVIDSVKEDLNRERRNRQRMEIVNSKLVNELAEVKKSAKRFLQDYEKERKARELMEEVCDELAKEIGEDKAEVEALKAESARIRDEVEEERKMLQMAEVWREERVQMKLIDAKLMLEEKYSQLSKLQSQIEAFLGACSKSVPDVLEKKEAEMLKEAAESVKVQEIKEFSYQPPPASEDIFSVFEELQPREDANERKIEQCFEHTNGMINGYVDKSVKRFANGMIAVNGDIEDDSGWETVSHAEEQGSSNSPEGSDPSVNGICEESNASVSGTDWDEKGENGKVYSEISEVCSTNTRLSRKKASSITRLWKSSRPSNGENYKKMLFEATNGRLSNGRMSNATLSPDRKSGEVCLSSPSVGQWSSPDSLNPHITRGTKGRIEWPKGMHKESLKAKLLEARMESQKIQLRQALKQKI